MKEKNRQEKECEREKKTHSDKEKNVQPLRESVFPNPLLGCLSQTGARKLEKSQGSMDAQGKKTELS